MSELTTPAWLTTIADADTIAAYTLCLRTADAMDQRGRKGKRLARRLRRAAGQIRTTARRRYTTLYGDRL